MFVLALLLYGYSPWTGACLPSRGADGARVVGRRSWGQRGVKRSSMFSMCAWLASIYQYTRYVGSPAGPVRLSWAVSQAPVRECRLVVDKSRFHRPTTVAPHRAAWSHHLPTALAQLDTIDPSPIICLEPPDGPHRPPNIAVPVTQQRRSQQRRHSVAGDKA